MNDDEKNESDLAALRALAPRDVDAAASARIRRIALDEIDAARDAGFAPKLVRVWSRVGVPVMLASVVLVYLGWAVQAAASLYR